MAYDSGFVKWCRSLSNPQKLPNKRGVVLEILSTALWKLYEQRVVILIDEYDSPMRCGIEHGYATDVPPFVTISLFELLTL